MADDFISRAERESFLGWLANEHLVELNGFGDRLRYLQQNPREAQPNEAREVLDRCAAHVDALSMVGESLLASVDGWAATRMKEDEDAFALGLALYALSADIEPRIARLSAAAQVHARHGAEVAEVIAARRASSKRAG